MPAPHLDPNCVELRAMALGMRQAWRLRVAPEHFERFSQRLGALGFVVTRSGATYAESQGGRLQPARSGVFLAVVAAQEAIARECLRLEVENTEKDDTGSPTGLQETLASHRLLGATYGYPDCCVDAFCDAHAEAVLRPSGLADNAWIIYRAAQRTRTFHPLLRAFGGERYEATASPLRHLPCRFDCTPSIELAAALIRDLETENPPLHKLYQRAPIADLWVATDGCVRSDDLPSRPAQSPILHARDAFPLVLGFRSRRYVSPGERD